jgi:hypothetical protein
MKPSARDAAYAFITAPKQSFISPIGGMKRGILLPRWKKSKIASGASYVKPVVRTWRSMWTRKMDNQLFSKVVFLQPKMINVELKTNIRQHSIFRIFNHRTL